MASGLTILLKRVIPAILGSVVGGTLALKQAEQIERRTPNEEEQSSTAQDNEADSELLREAKSMVEREERDAKMWSLVDKLKAEKKKLKVAEEDSELVEEAKDMLEFRERSKKMWDLVHKMEDEKEKMKTAST